MLEKISKPYAIRVSDKARLAGFDDARFPNKQAAREFVRRVQTADPEFNPSLVAFFRYLDTATGALYATRAEYEAEQHRQRTWRDTCTKN